MTPREIDVSRIVEERSLNGFNYRLIAVSWLLTIFDGFDLSIAAFAAPYMRDDMGLEPNQLANILSSGLLGTFLGAILFASISDRIGRRPVLLGCSVAFALLTIAMGFAPSYEWLVVLRFFDGIAIGAVIPIAWALNSEYVPRRMRATVVTIIMVGYSIGISGAGPITVLLEPTVGWRGLFIVGGAGSLVAATILFFALPESIRWLTGQPGQQRRLIAVLGKLGHDTRDLSISDRFVLSDEPAEQTSKPHVRELFAGWLKFATPAIWLAYTASSIAVYYVNGWGPIILEELDFSRNTAALATAFGGIMGSVAGLAVMRFTDRYGPVMALFYPALLLPLLLVLGLVPLSHTAVLVLSMTVLAFVGGMTFCIISIIAPVYPTRIRATGSGWASSIGKLGGVLGPIFGGWMLASGLPIIRSFAALAIMPALVVIAVVGILLAKRHFAQKAPAPDAPAAEAAVAA
ncbi:MFS transporter [Aurantiacibacter xanthus]|uniref:MFS transporter n=1 Tax=Aurantiacibacter xanthus TaxID=1784712 RepID=A0A3A1P5S4_9SPHN|nr:MFS transporter [Aurantiacibacter xanthus]RIV86331.1 MFS transporter [Aurantiacibacter xanthus]